MEPESQPTPQELPPQTPEIPPVSQPPVGAVPTPTPPAAMPVMNTILQPQMATPVQPMPVTVSFNQHSANGEFPEELRKWNWGAFLLSWLWAISNNTYIGLLALVPVINIYMIIALGIKGNEWAWKNRKFQSIEHFKKVQRTWAWWGLGVFIVSLLGFVLLIALGTHAQNQIAPKYDATRKSDINQITKDLTAYGADPRNDGILPFSLAGLGKTEPIDPETGFDYTYTPSDSGAQAEVCATLSDATTYCQTAEVPIVSPTPDDGE